MRLVLAMDPVPAAALAADAARFGHEVATLAAGAQQLSVAVAQYAPDLVVAASRVDFLTAGVLSQCDTRGVRVIALVANDSERRHGATLGLYEFADAGAGWSALEELIVGPRLPVEPPPAAHGTVIAVWGPAGSPGRTSLAIGIAVELAAAGHSVALVDVDTHGASIAPALGMLDEAPGFAAACRLAGGGALDRAELERIGQRYGDARSGFWVLTGIGRASRWPELSSERVRETVARCRDWVDFTILDTSSSLENDEEISSDLFAPRRNGATLTALREADTVIAVGAADPVGLSRFLRAHVDLLEIVEPHRILVVMNKLRASAIGLNPAGQVSQTLTRFGGVDAAGLVPFDQPAFDAAILSGKTVAEVAPKSPARLAIRTLVRSRVAADRVPAHSGRLVRGRRSPRG